MNDIAHQLYQVVNTATELLRSVPEARLKPDAKDGGWSARQVLGHLIDSAANNHARFVRAQFLDDLVFDGYDQEQWVQAQHYNEEGWLELVELWRAYNLHLAHVIAHLPQAELVRRRHPHSLDRIAWQTRFAGEPVTLEYLARDYIGHLQAHLEQLFATFQE